MKHTISILMALVMTLSAASSTHAKYLARPDYAVGWLYTPVASGVSIKFPLDETVYIQPVFALTLYDGSGKTEGNYALGIRGLVGFPTAHNLHPYLGVGFGHQRSFHGSSLRHSTTDEERTGFQAFFGMEYKKYTFRPALEIGITGIARSDGSLRVGTSANFGVYYYF